MKYNPVIDGLRAIAVLAVVAYHAGLPVPGGFIGVDIFFVISGYLITGILQRELQETGRIDYRHFYGRRVRRIFPALLVVVATTIAISALLGPSARHAVSESAAASLAMVGNVYFQAVTGGYFDASSEQMPLLHLWSLGVEEQFYLLWPLLLTLFIRGRQAPLLVLAVLSFALAQYLLATNPEAAFYQMPARGWELAAGSWLALRSQPTPPPRWAGVAGIAVLLVAIVFPFPPAQFPGVGAAPAVAGSMLVIYGSHARESLANRLLSSKPFTFIGLISYGFYLWHWPLLAIHRTITLDAGIAPAIGLCVVAGCLATLSYRYVETPIRCGKRQPRMGAAVLMGFACIGAFASVAAPLASAPAPSNAVAAPQSWVIEIRDRQCTVVLGRTTPVGKNCRPADANVVLWGDSHASAWRPFALSLGTVADFSMDSCTPVIGWSTEHPRFPTHRQDCLAHNAAAVGFIQRGAETVIISAFLRDRMEALPSIGTAVDAIAPHAGKVLLMMPTPYPKKSATECIQFHLPCAMSRDEYNAYADPVRHQYLAIAAHHSNVRVVEVSDFFCTDTACPIVRYGYPLYLDAHHITAKAASDFRLPAFSGAH